MSIPPEADWLLQTLGSPVNLFNSLHTFDEMVERCKRNGYEVHEFDCREFKSQEEIYNAILHSVGELKRENFYKNIMHIQFWDLFRTPWLKVDCQILMAFRYFDTFYRIDPECGQQLMSLMAGWNYRSLQKQTRFIVCVHSEDPRLELEPVLIMKAGWNTRESFSEKADIGRQKLEKATSWWISIMERIRAEGLTTATSVNLAFDIAHLLGLEGVVGLHEANPAFEEIVSVINRKNKAESWWEASIEEFNMRSQTWHTSGPPRIQLQRRMGVRSIVELCELDLQPEELLKLLGEIEAAELERRKTDPRYLDRDWHEKVAELFNAQSDVPKSIHEIYGGLNLLDEEGTERPNRLNSTPAEAVKMLLKLDPEKWRDSGPKTKIVKIEDKNLEL